MTTTTTEKKAPAKNNDKPKAETAPAEAATTTKPETVGDALPAGYLSTASDAVGFFDPDLRADGNKEGKGFGLPIHCVPMHVILSDSNIDKEKPSALVFVRLIDPCAAVRDGAGEGKMDERPLIETKRGDVVGIWFSSGMRDLAMLGGAKVYLRQEPADKWKKIKNKPSKMKTFQIASAPDRQGVKLVVREDRRDQSAGVVAAPFAGKKLAGASAVDRGDAGETDDLPF